MMTFEHPLNERIRTMLRLEHLFAQLDYFIPQPDPWATRAAIGALVEIIDITARADVRSELLKEIERHVSTLRRLTHQRGVDPSALAGVLGDLSEADAALQQLSGPLGRRAHEDDFIKAVVQRSCLPGATCRFDLPHFHYWLLQPPESRHASFDNWLSDLKPASAAIQLLLSLLRSSATPHAVLAERGLFQDALDPHAPLQLLQLQLDPDTALYPEVSGHKNRFNIRFMQVQPNGQTAHYQHDVAFHLTCCVF